MLLAGLALLIVFVGGIGSRRPSRWRIHPGPRPVSVAATRRCLASTASLTVTRAGAKTLGVGFVNGATLRLAFVRGEGRAMRLAPWSFAPALRRSSLNNVVITRPERSLQPPSASLRVLGRCLIAP